MIEIVFSKLFSDSQNRLFSKPQKAESNCPINSNLCRVAVAEWLARPPTKQEVCGSNPASYLC